jgi:predicted DNA-binding transcriptional regulator YafY
MPQVKNAFMRFRIIDRCIRSEERPFPSKEELRLACEEELFGSIEREHICDSTIEKDLFALRMEHDAPILYSKREKGYYYSDKNYSIDKGPLSSKDIDTLTVAAATLSQFKGMDFYKEYGFALDRIINRIQHGENVNSKQTTKDTEIIQFETGFGNSGQEHIELLLSAIQQKKEIWFDYQSFNSETSKRRKTTPLLLKEYRNRWYLICYDLVKEAIMTFGLDRMEHIEVSDLSAQQPNQFNPDFYFKHAVGITVTSEQPVEITFKANAIASKYLISQPLHESQQLINETKEHSTFNLFVLITEELVRTILSYGGEIEILEPNSLRDSIRNRILRMKEVYS